MTRLLAILLLSTALSACQAQSDTTTEAQSAAAPTPASTVAAADTSDYPPIHVYKTPGCTCCEKWAGHLRAAGFEVELEETTELVQLKSQLGVPTEHASCHTGVVGDYVVEGHVPAEDIKQLLDEEPDAVGIAVPAMPVGSPGMEMAGHPGEPFDVLLLHEDSTASVYSHYEPRSSD